jgi:hypothetical protein
VTDNARDNGAVGDPKSSVDAVIPDSDRLSPPSPASSPKAQPSVYSGSGDPDSTQTRSTSCAPPADDDDDDSTTDGGHGAVGVLPREDQPPGEPSFCSSHWILLNSLQMSLLQSRRLSTLFAHLRTRLFSTPMQIRGSRHGSVASASYLTTLLGKRWCQNGCSTKCRSRLKA